MQVIIILVFVNSIIFSVLKDTIHARVSNVENVQPKLYHFLGPQKVNNFHFTPLGP